jgi:hypothetical protein
VPPPPQGPPASTAARLSLGSEWPLVFFTLVAAVLVGLEAASFASPIAVEPLVFLAVAVLAMVVSTLHLGRKERAWRAISNLRQSWLSREVFFFGAFVALSAVHLVLLPGSHAARIAAVVSGALALVSIDRVYGAMAIHRVARARPDLVPPERMHSAQVVMTAALIAGCLVWNVWLIAGFGGLKLLLYLQRKIGHARRGGAWRPLVSIVRIGVGFVAPVAAWIIAPPMYGAWVTGFVLAGELVDRCEFYAELELVTPGRLLAREEASRVGRAGSGEMTQDRPSSADI